jgi:hypothetical protein
VDFSARKSKVFTPREYNNFSKAEKPSVKLHKRLPLLDGCPNTSQGIQIPARLSSKSIKNTPKNR